MTEVEMLAAWWVNKLDFSDTTMDIKGGLTLRSGRLLPIPQSLLHHLISACPELATLLSERSTVQSQPFALRLLQSKSAGRGGRRVLQSVPPYLQLRYLSNCEIIIACC